jgi:hypothetical protein
MNAPGMSAPIENKRIHHATTFRDVPRLFPTATFIKHFIEINREKNGNAFQYQSLKAIDANRTTRNTEERRGWEGRRVRIAWILQWL